MDGLRAVAVALVVLFHAGFSWIGGTVGVQLFFVLSGFLITRLLLGEFAETGTVGYGEFLLRRALRILPAYYVFLIATFLLDRHLGDAWPRSMTLSALTYVYNYWVVAQRTQLTSIDQTWSLAVEEHFYLVWPLVFLVLARRRRVWLCAVTAVLVLAVLVWRCALLAETGNLVMAYNRSDTRIDAILVGCLFAGALTFPSAQRAATKLAVWWGPLVTVVLLGADQIPSHTFQYSVGFTVEAVLCAVLLVQLLQLSATRGWRWLDSRGARQIGALSYSLYLWHMWGFRFGSHLPDWPGLHFLGGTLIGLGLAAGSYYLVERPVLTLRARKIRKPALSPAF